MSKEQPPIPPIIDLRRWREVRSKRTGAPPRSSGNENENEAPWLARPAAPRTPRSPKPAPPRPVAPPTPFRMTPLTPEDLYPARLGWLWRILALIGGAMFFAMGAGLLYLLFFKIDDPDLKAWLLILPVGGIIALFGLDLMLRGILGVEWSIRFWLRAGPWLVRRFFAPLDRHLPPARFFLGLGVILVGVGLWSGGTDPSAWRSAVFLLVLFIHILAHEWGHLFAVRRVGYIPLSLVAGPLLVELRGPRPVAGGNPSWLTTLFGGFVLWAALPERRAWARDFAVVVAGPLVTLLLWGGVILADHFQLFGGSPVFAQIVRINKVCITVVLITNLIPLRTIEGVATDGRQLLDLLRGRLVS